nr:translation initiation factor IF-2-like [Pongo abelii]
MAKPESPGGQRAAGPSTRRAPRFARGSARRRRLPRALPRGRALDWPWPGRGSQFGPGCPRPPPTSAPALCTAIATTPGAGSRGPVGRWPRARSALGRPCSPPPGPAAPQPRNNLAGRGPALGQRGRARRLSRWREAAASPPASVRVPRTPRSRPRELGAPHQGNPQPGSGFPRSSSPKPLRVSRRKGHTQAPCDRDARPTYKERLVNRGAWETTEITRSRCFQALGWASRPSLSTHVFPPNPGEGTRTSASLRGGPASAPPGGHTDKSEAGLPGECTRLPCLDHPVHRDPISGPTLRSTIPSRRCSCAAALQAAGTR